MAVDAAGTVYVADWGNQRVQAFAADGTYLAQWGESGTDDGQFDGASDVAVAADGTVYVTDYYNHRVQTFEPTPS